MFNRTFNPVLISVLAFGATLAMAQPDISWQYEFHKLEFPGSAESFPLGINNNGDIAGYYIDTKGVGHGYTYFKGKFATVDYPGGNMAPGFGSFVGGINDHRDLVGDYFDAAGFQHGFIRTMPDGCDGDGDADDSSVKCKPIYTSTDVPGAFKTQVDFEFGPGLGTNAIGLNNQRQIVGIYASTAITSSGYLFANGKYRKIDDPLAGKFTGDGTKLFGINEFGDIAGDYITQTDGSASAVPITHGFLYDGKTFRSVYVDGSEKGGFGTQANGINNRDEVVGTYTDPQGSLHGLYWAGGQAFRLDFPGMPYSEVHVINDRGDVTGAFSNAAMQQLFGFVAYRKR